jgi:hypothetical protein
VIICIERKTVVNLPVSAVLLPGITDTFRLPHSGWGNQVNNRFLVNSASGILNECRKLIQRGVFNSRIYRIFLMRTRR